MPGGAANVAANITGLGGQVLLAGVTGDDEPGRHLRASLLDCGLALDGIFVDRIARPQPRPACWHPGNKWSGSIANDGPLAGCVGDRPAGLAGPAPAATNTCVLSDYGKGVVTPRVAAEFLRCARQSSKPILVDPKGTDYRRYRGAALIKPNLREVEQVLGYPIHDEAALAEAGRRLAKVLPGTAVLVTRGPEGMTLFRFGEPALHVAAATRNVYDVTGAGDTVVGTSALALAAGAVLEEAVRLANQAAGIAVSKVGTAIVTRYELAGTSP